MLGVACSTSTGKEGQPVGPERYRTTVSMLLRDYNEQKNCYMEPDTVVTVSEPIEVPVVGLVLELTPYPLTEATMGKCSGAMTEENFEAALKDGQMISLGSPEGN